MIRATLNSYAVAFLGITVSSLMMLSACGNTADNVDEASHSLALTESVADNIADDDATGINSADDTCAPLMDTIHEGRAAVSATPEWDAFAATPEWQQVKLDGEVIKKLGCKSTDQFPTNACLTMKQKIKDHFKLAQATDAYKAVSALQVWKDLEAAYDAAREANCLPSQQEAGSQNQ